MVDKNELNLSELPFLENYLAQNTGLGTPNGRKNAQNARFEQVSRKLNESLQKSMLVRELRSDSSFHVESANTAHLQQMDNDDDFRPVEAVQD